MINPTTVVQNYRRVREVINEACQLVGRDPSEVAILPVSKTQPVTMIEPLIKLGCLSFGENRVQEMAAKAGELDGKVSWILIGHLQRNKVALAASVMSQLQSLDSLRLALAIQRHFDSAGIERRLPVLVEVNTSNQATKTGLPPDQVIYFTSQLSSFDHLQPCGLMTVAHTDPEMAQVGFATLANLLSQLQDRDGGGWAELSMGMSGDYKAAIQHGSTCVRIGTAIFGMR